MALKVEIDNGAGPAGSQVPIYVGYAAAGAATSVAAWRIIKITYSAFDDPTAVLYADGTDAFDKVWDLRATYVYS